MVKNLPANEGHTEDVDLISGSGRSPREVNGNPLQYSFLENSIDEGAWWTAVHGVTKSQTWLSLHAHTHINTHKSSTSVVLLEEGNYSSSIQLSSVAQSFPTLRNPTDRSTPDLLVYHQLLEFTPNHVCWVGDAIQPSHPLLSPSPPAFNLSQHQVFSNESALYIRWPKYWSFSFIISSSSEHPGLISRMDWLDFLADQGTIMSLL